MYHARNERCIRCDSQARRLHTLVRAVHADSGKLVPETALHPRNRGIYYLPSFRIDDTDAVVEEPGKIAIRRIIGDR